MVTIGEMDCRVARWEAGRTVRSSAWVTGLGGDEENWIYLEYFWQSQWYSDGLGIVGEAKQIQEKNFKVWT